MECLPSEIQRIEEVNEGLQRLGAALSSTPIFGHMRLVTSHGDMHVFLGSASVHGEGASVIDWRQAPLAEVFFTHEENDVYELDLGDRLITGQLVRKSLVTLSGKKLVGIETPQFRALQSHSGQWRYASEKTDVLPLRPEHARRAFRSPLEVELDAVQRKAVDLPDHQSVLLLGEAGFGKTTVALHRLVAMKQRRGRAFSAAVLVPTEGLRRLTELMLLRRGVTDIEVSTLDEWARTLARRAFRFLPRRESTHTPSYVMKLKRHPALREILREFVRQRPFPATDEGRKSENRGWASRADLEHLFGDAKWMNEVIEKSQGGLFPQVAKEVLAHTKIQFSDPAEKTYAHFSADSLQTADGRGLDDGTPMEDANSIDAEDYPVLFELDFLRARQKHRPPLDLRRYDCIVVDEAQEFSPLELALIGKTLRKNGSVIVAGDAAQRVDPRASFAGWDHVMEELGAPNAHRVVLEVNYRCPEDVTALARAVVGLGPVPPSANNAGSVMRVQKDNLFHLAVWLAEELTRLLNVDATSSIAVVTRTAESAKILHQALEYGTDATLALGGNFEFRPGLLVTCVQEVKGLEFDYVVVPDASASTYPDTAESRRALYVAMTRATHRLTLVSVGPPSPVLGPPDETPPKL